MTQVNAKLSNLGTPIMPTALPPGPDNDSHAGNYKNVSLLGGPPPDAPIEVPVMVGQPVGGMGLPPEMPVPSPESLLAGGIASIPGVTSLPQMPMQPDPSLKHQTMPGGPPKTVPKGKVEVTYGPAPGEPVWW